jgi:hypothetical protein
VIGKGGVLVAVKDAGVGYFQGGVTEIRGHISRRMLCGDNSRAEAAEDLGALFKLREKICEVRR